MIKIATIFLFSISCMHSAPKRGSRPVRAQPDEIAKLKRYFVHGFLTATNENVAIHYANRSVGNHPFLIAMRGEASCPTATPEQILQTKAAAAERALTLAQQLQSHGVDTIDIIQPEQYNLDHMGYLDCDVEGEVQTLGASIHVQTAAAQALAVKMQQSSINE